MDVVYLFLMLALFASGFGLTALCERLRGPS